MERAFVARSTTRRAAPGRLTRELSEQDAGRFYGLTFAQQDMRRTARSLRADIDISARDLDGLID